MNKTNLLLAACTLVMVAHASTITLDSSAGTTTNNSGNSTVNIDPNPSWATALPGSHWISDAQTGNPSDPGYVVLPNGTQVLFTQSFMLNSAATSGSLTVMADDTTSVIVNGTQIFAAALNPPGGYPTCSSQAIGCLSSTSESFTFAQLSPYLHVGANSIQFDVYQEQMVSFGLDYAGSISTGQVPEPASLGLIGGGLVLIGMMSRLGRKPKASERASDAA